MIWQGERDDGRLAFMYWPVLATLVQGFLHMSSVRLEVGSALTADYEEKIETLKRDDVLLWVCLRIYPPG